MYGLIHRAVRQMATDRLGAEQWRVLSRAADVHDDDMISAKVYSDETTMRLIGAVSAELDVPMEDMLEQFGQYWVRFAGESAYAPMLDLAGSNLLDCLFNLDRLHSGIKLTLPDAELPSFSVLDHGRGYVNVRYSSIRVGLEPFVKGLLAGLLARFDLVGSVVAIGPSDLGIVFHVVFED